MGSAAPRWTMGARWSRAFDAERAHWSQAGSAHSDVNRDLEREMTGAVGLIAWSPGGWSRRDQPETDGQWKVAPTGKRRVRGGPGRTVGPTRGRMAPPRRVPAQIVGCACGVTLLYLSSTKTGQRCGGGTKLGSGDRPARYPGAWEAIMQSMLLWFAWFGFTAPAPTRRQIAVARARRLALRREMQLRTGLQRAG